MRVPSLTVLAALAIAGCSSGTRTIIVVRDQPAAPVVPAPAPAPVIVRPAAPAPLPALEVAVGRPASGRLVVQTNRPAYVAIFEIVPSQGVTLAHPSSLRQSTMLLSGISTVPVNFGVAAPERRVSTPGRAARPTRYIYAIASDKPLRISDAAFEEGYLERVLGPGLYRAPTPQPLTQALVRHFAPAALEGKWAQDLYTVAPSDDTAPYRVARIYCAGGTVYEVPENIADRAWCPSSPPGNNGRGRGNGGQTADASSARPDSVFAHDGRRIGRGSGPQGRGLGVQNRDEARASAPEAPTAPKPNVDHRKPDHAVATPTPAAGGNGQADRNRVEKERVEKERVEKERVEKERVEKERVEKERVEKDKLEKDKLEKDKLEKERSERERAETERGNKERAEKEKAEKDRSEREQAASDAAQKEHAASERAAESARLKRERQVADSVAADKAEKDKAEKDKAEKDKAEKDKAEKDKAEKDKAEKDKAEKDKAEKDKAEKDKAEKDKAEKEKADKEKADKEKADKDKAEKEKAPKPDAAAAADSSDGKDDKKKRRPPVPNGPPTFR